MVHQFNVDKSYSLSLKNVAYLTLNWYYIHDCKYEYVRNCFISSVFKLHTYCSWFSLSQI